MSIKLRIREKFWDTERNQATYLNEVKRFVETGRMSLRSD